MELQDGQGLYRTGFIIPNEWRGRRLFLRFGGVAYGFEAFLNGNSIGQHYASAYNPTVLEITDALDFDAVNGEQILAVRVTTKPMGWEFDANDDWALSGIFRDVTVFSVPEVFVKDFSTETHLIENGAVAELRLQVQLENSDGLQPEVKAVLESPASENEIWEVHGRVSKDGRIEQLFRIANPKLWTAETPELYDLTVSVIENGIELQRFSKRIGLREITIEDGVLKLNGTAIKLRGVNRHDEAPNVGRAVRGYHFRRDIELMKQGNVNFVRTSHYPPHERFIELCDELGLYVMCEVSIGKGEEHQVDPAYFDNILRRTRATIDRDKNNASVIIWSIGNENPVNEAELAASKLAKALDPTRPICIPKIGSYFLENYEQIPEFVDIYSPHYPTNQMLEGYVQKLHRPTIFTEYAHALGLATDRIQAQWEVMQQTPQFAGGSIWHLMDQGLLRYDANGVDVNEPTLVAWRDKYHYYDTNGNDGGDGVVYADRTPQTDFWLMRKVYSPVQFGPAEVVKNGKGVVVKMSVENRYDFTSLDQVSLTWNLKKNGQLHDSGESLLAAPPHRAENLEFEILTPNVVADSADFLTLELQCIDANGISVNEETVLLSDLLKADDLLVDNAVSLPTLEQSDEVVEISFEAGRLKVDKKTGNVTMMDRFGRDVLKGISPRAGRVTTMSERRVAGKTGLWKQPLLQSVGMLNVSAQHEDEDVVVRISGIWEEADEPEKRFAGAYSLRLMPTGLMEVSYDFQVSGDGMLAEAGLSMMMPRQLSEFRWVGQGPYAGYPGKNKLTTFGAYHLNAEDLYFKGNRRETNLAMLTRPEGWGVALSCEPGDVAVERYEGLFVLSHNALISGLGNKFVPPETQVRVSENERVAGHFELQLLNENWSEPLVKWFGKPGTSAQVFKPFYHSYDQ